MGAIGKPGSVETWTPGAPDILRAVNALSRRWHKARTFPGDFHAGRRCAYAQAIALLLDEPYGNVLMALEEDRL